VLVVRVISVPTLGAGAGAGAAVVETGAQVPAEGGTLPRARTSVEVDTERSRHRTPS
jgi:hypothetical protein